jgi:ppGpp synthetase/RelA/SpoT-type nucleotidyltranferase
MVVQNAASGRQEMDLSPEIVRFIEDELPAPYNTEHAYERYFIPKLQFHSILCTTTIAAANQIIAPLVKKHSERFFCRIDDSHPIKAPASIIDKIPRSRDQARMKQEKGEVPGVVYDINNFDRQMTDLARFRIVCNFLSDVYEVSDSFRQDPGIQVFFIVADLKNTITQRKRVSGERSIKIILKQKSRGYFLEVQIMTQLEEAWDKKDHYLVYERKRNSQENDEDLFPTNLDAKMSAMSELLYIADDYFDQLRKDGEGEVQDDETL